MFCQHVLSRFFTACGLGGLVQKLHRMDREESHDETAAESAGCTTSSLASISTEAGLTGWEINRAHLHSGRPGSSVAGKLSLFGGSKHDLMAIVLKHEPRSLPNMQVLG